MPPFDPESDNFGKQVGWGVAIIIAVVVVLLISAVVVAAHFIAKVW